MTDDEVVELVINPSRAQYRQLAEDFEVLRAAGAESNTQAVVEAVREAADDARDGAPTRDLTKLRRQLLRADTTPDERLTILRQYVDVCLAAIDRRNAAMGASPRNASLPVSEELHALRERRCLTAEVQWAQDAMEFVQTEAT